MMVAAGMLALVCAQEAAASEPLVEALRAELDRAAAELRLPDAPPVHLIQYNVDDYVRVQAHARLGAMTSDNLWQARRLAVGVRVGSPEFDSANFVAGWRGGGFSSKSLVLDDRPDALRQDAWLQTDRLYREAVENLAIKEAARARMAVAVDVPDYSPPAPLRHDGGAHPAAELARLRDVAKQVSAVFRVHPGIEWSTVYATSETGRDIVLNSLGTEVIVPHSELVVRIVARARAADGTAQVDHATHIVRHMDQLPPTSQLEQEAEALAQRMEAWSALEATSESYVGPVIFEGDAAVELFRHLLMSAFNGTPPEGRPPEGSRTIFFSGATAEGQPAMRPMRRVLPEGFDVVDDPTIDPSLPSSFTHDIEGVPAQRVELVKDGIVRRHLASATPSEHEPQSNGHARGSASSLPRAMASNLQVRPRSATSSRRLRKQALRLAADYDLDHVVVVRRVADPALSKVGLPPSYDFAESGAGFPPPVEVVRVYADGREVPVRGWRFGELDRRLLRDIAAAGPSQTATVYGLPTGKLPSSPTAGVPVTLTVPDVLVTELELRPGTENAQKAPPVPSPLADGG